MSDTNTAHRDDSTRITVRVPTPLATELRQLAASEDRTVSDQVRHLIRDSVNAPSERVTR